MLFSFIILAALILLPLPMAIEIFYYRKKENLSKISLILLLSWICIVVVLFCSEIMPTFIDNLQKV